MKCEIIRNEDRIAGPLEFEAATVRDIIARQGGDYRLVPNDLSAAVKIGSIVIKPVREVKPSTGRMSYLGMATREEFETEVVYTYPAMERDIESVRSSLVSELADIHNTYDSGLFEYQGVAIKSDLEARINATGTLKAFEGGQLTSTVWRGQSVSALKSSDELMLEPTEEGPTKVAINSLEEMQALYMAIFAHLNIGFAVKEAMEARIAAATADELATLNVKSEFDAMAAAA